MLDLNEESSSSSAFCIIAKLSFAGDFLEKIIPRYLLRTRSSQWHLKQQQQQPSIIITIETITTTIHGLEWLERIEARGVCRCRMQMIGERIEEEWCRMIRLPGVYEERPWKSGTERRRGRRRRWFQRRSVNPSSVIAFCFFCSSLLTKFSSLSSIQVQLWKKRKEEDEEIRSVFYVCAS